MYEVDKIQYLQIGVEGESNAMKLEIDVSAWAEEYPDAAFHILFKPYNSETAYPQEITYDHEKKVIEWTVGLGATAIVGVGYTEIRAQDEANNIVKKTRIIPTAVENSVSGLDTTPPSPEQGWVTEVLNAKTAAEAAQDAAEDAQEAAETAQGLAEDARDAAQAAAGNFQGLTANVTGLAAGASPTIEVTHSEGGLYNMAFGIPKGDKGDKGDQGDPAPAEQVVPAVDDWLDDHITNPSNPPLDTSLSLSNAAAPANLVGDLKSALSTGMWGIDANWARGKIENGAYSGNDYYKVATQQPVHFEVGDIITIATGYKCSVWIITSNSYFDIGWQTGEYAISVTGDYMLCVTSDPAPESAITDISLYTSKLKRTDNAQNQLNNILKYIRDKIEPNFDPGKNLFNKTFVSSNYLVNHDYGVLVYNANNSASDFIRVYNGETIYKKKCNNWYVALYNLDFSYAGSLANANDVTIPQDGYIRVTVANADIDDAIIARTSALPQASDCKSSMIDRVARKEIEEMKTWSNTIETVASMEEIRDISSHALGSVDLSEYAFASIRINNTLGVPCTMNLYDDRIGASTNWMMRPDGSFVSVNIPAGSSIITDDDLKELPYLKLFRPIIIASSAPTSGYITIQIVGRK